MASTIKIHTKNYDSVIEGQFLTGFTDYQVAIDSLYPLINRLDIQRKIQNETFYKRLEEDLKAGCIMPPLTIAFIEKKDLSLFNVVKFQSYINTNIKKGFILDGIQRLNTLKRVYDRKDLNLKNPIFLNIIICKSRDNLLYRMVTLNNGQKPMTARHQIEILASNLYDFNEFGLKVLTEKEAASAKGKKFFKKSDMISGYIAFLSNTTSLENSKIIESKMDELIARKIIESNITKGDVSFTAVIIELSRLSDNDECFQWLKNLNNLIGFCVGIKKSISTIKKTTPNRFAESLQSFEEAFEKFDVSKIKLSRERRKLSQYFIENYVDLKNLDPDDLLLAFNELD